MRTDNLFNVSGKKVLITGSTGGLGSSFAKGMAENGAVVILNGRNTEKLKTQLQQFQEWGFKAYGYAFDVTDSEQINNAVEQINSEVGTIDVLVNNAGINIRAPLEVYEDIDWEKVIATNLTAAFKVSRAVVKKMIEQKSGKIINIGSMQSELGRATIAAYAASKGGIKMLTRAMAVDWAKYNIQVNGIGPGYFKTDLTKPLYENPEFDAWLCGRTPSNRWGDPDELLGALIYLSSAASNYTNGQMIYVDGGLLAAI
ncbi:MAG: SDR family NAD(P)-dependent oxidoreductase [Prolixibacteraceae bacterium]|jgi:gluconate 5-dehydrogenase|nr:SDR family NAD(P)-dependent oxidoreductase [Prolixibacteraceae bacterium]